MGRFGIRVEAGFCATHQLRLADGTVEPVHGHDWGVRAVFRTVELDAQGMVLDFHEAERAVQAAVAGWQHGHLNELGDFTGRNPTAEVVAEVLFLQLRRGGLHTISRVEITEAPHCTAFYEADEISR